MTAYEYLRRYGKAHAANMMEVLKPRKSSYAYFSQLAFGHRTPSATFAQRLIKASGGEMSLEDLLFPPADRSAPRKAKVKRKTKARSKTKTASYVTERQKQHQSKV